MHIIVAGGTGFLGRALVGRLRAEAAAVTVLTRRARGADEVAWNPDGTVGSWAAAIEGADAVVNLAGESLASGRWTGPRKARIRESRIRATRSLATALERATRRPPVFLSGSAIGYYGPHGDEPLAEQAPPGNDFLASVCREWEAEAVRAAALTRVVLLRTGIALEKDGGALPQMALPFRLFAGGPVGSGRQYQSWIHRDDWVSLVTWALRNEVTGPLNLTAPNPVTNREFAKTLGSVLRRPSFVPAPAFAMRLLLGEMAEGLLLTGQRVLPAAAEARGFTFEYPVLNSALRAIYGPS